MKSAYSFKQSAYDVFDDSKWVIVKYLNDRGNITSCLENYDADITSYQPVMHEVEVKSGWDSEWPLAWDTLQIPSRKRKLIKKHGRVFFWVLNKQRTKAWCVDSDVMTDEMIKEVPNRRHESGELFYQVPISLCKAIEVA